MARFITIASLTAATLLAGTPAFAQFPNIFEQLFRIEPPRPPADVNRPLPPPGTRPQTGLPPGPPPGRIQQRPLPPPPSSQRQDANLPGSVPGSVPGQRQPQVTPPPQPANTAPQPGDEVIMEPPAQKIVNPTAVFSGLDKITGRIISFDVAINETVRFGALEVTPRVCYTRPPTMAANTDAFRVNCGASSPAGCLRRVPV
jgi:hypothetical protein